MFLRGFYRFRNSALDEFADNERLEEFNRHFLRKSALMQFEFGSDDDNRTTGIIYALAEQILAESSLLAFERIGKRFERARSIGFDCRSAARIIEERIHRFLQHALFIAQDDLRSFDVHQPLEAVVADNNASVKIVKIA